MFEIIVHQFLMNIGNEDIQIVYHMKF
jgi:hypothetical protein